MRAFLLLLLGLSTARAEPAPSKLGVTVMNLLGGRINPLGLEDQLHLSVDLPLYRSSRPVLENNYFLFGLAPKLSPSRFRWGAELEIQPLSIFNLRVVGELVSYFDVFGQLQSFGSPLDEFSDSALDRGKSRSYRTTGTHVMIQPTLQLKFGPIALVARVSAEYWNMNLREGDRVFYDGGVDTLVSRNGWLIQTDLDLAWVTRVRLVVGLRYTVLQPLYGASDYRPDEDPAINPNRMQRLGPILAYTVFEKPRSRIRNLTLALIVGWYLEQRWRTGADVSPGLPWGTLALWFYSDLVPR